MGMSNPVKEIGDVVSFGTLAGYVAGLLPSVATLLTVVWLAIRIYESETVQGMLKRGKKTDQDKRERRSSDKEL